MKRFLHLHPSMVDAVFNINLIRFGIMEEAHLHKDSSGEERLTLAADGSISWD